MRSKYTGKERRYLNSKHWRNLRERILTREPLCRNCKANGFTVAANEIDHIVPRAKGGGNQRSNLQPLCRSCHWEKTRIENRRMPVRCKHGWPVGECVDCAAG